MVAALDRRAFAQIGDAATRLLEVSAAPSASLAGLDLRRDIRYLRYCKMPAPAGAAPGKVNSFVVLMSGAIPANAIAAAAAAPNAPAKLQDLDGVSVLATDRVWIARRGSTANDGELVMATNRELLRAALFDQPESYDTDPGFPLSIVMAPSGVRTVFASSEQGDASPLATVRRLHIDLQTGAVGVIARFVVGDTDKAHALARDVAPALDALVRKLAGEPAPKVSIDVADRDVLAHVDLPPGVLQALALRLNVRGRHGIPR